jgi:proteasome lid subunit RPN8/RPN11
MNGELQNAISISRSHYEIMLADVSRRAPEEACGIIAGNNRRTSRVYVVPNALHSPTAFRMDAQKQIEAFLEMEKDNQEMLAIYHSHPTGPEIPSETDKTEFAYPGVLTLIWFLKEGTWDCRAYWINDAMAFEASLLLIENE